MQLRLPRGQLRWLREELGCVRSRIVWSSILSSRLRLFGIAVSEILVGIRWRAMLTAPAKPCEVYDACDEEDTERNADS